MTRKAEEKKQYILDTARGVFARKGFQDVTMKDIVDACRISRGGLYLYFSSTEEILLAILSQDARKSDTAFEADIRSRTSAREILELFLERQKKELLSESDALSRARLEYGFSHPDTKFFRKKFDDAVRVLEYLIRIGTRRGELKCESPHDGAVTIMLVIEGFRVSSGVTGVMEEEIDREFSFLLSSIT